MNCILTRRPASFPPAIPLRPHNTQWRDHPKRRPPDRNHAWVRARAGADGDGRQRDVARSTANQLDAARRRVVEVENRPDWDWRSGEPADKAGGYAVQGRAAVFIRRIAGSYSAIMGLPLYETAELLATLPQPTTTTTEVHG